MTAREWFEDAQKNGYAIGAFNVDNLDIMRAVCIAAKSRISPVMLEFSPGEVGYFGLENIVDLVSNAREQYKIPILLNLDHAKVLEDCMVAVGAGFDDVHFDGSELDFDQNVGIIKKIVEVARKKGVLVEGEINRLPGTSESHQKEIDASEIKKSYTDPVKAGDFVKQTNVDIFAAVFGNVHGTFPNQPDLDFDLLTKIREKLPNTFLSMHGGSGIPASQVKEAIEVGKIVKVNVNTEIRQAFHDALIEQVGEKPQEATYYKLSDEIVGSVAAVIEGKIEVFGSGGKA